MYLERLAMDWRREGCDLTLPWPERVEVVQRMRHLLVFHYVSARTMVWSAGL